MKKIIIISILLCSVVTTAQTVTGVLKHHAGQQVSLTGFNYYTNYELAKTTLDSLGNFTLTYPKDYKGMAILKTQDNSSLVFVLAEPNIHLKGNHLAETDSLQFTNSAENSCFIQYAKEQGLRSNALSAIAFLRPLYQNQPLLAKQKKFLKTLTKEQVRLQDADAKFIASLPNESYVRWFIPYRKMVQEMPAIVRKKTEEIPSAISFFRTTDFNHLNFKTSGIFKDFIEGHYLLLENMGQSLDRIATQMNLSTGYLLDNLKQNKPVLKSTAKELFTYFEKRSLSQAAAHLSASLINQYSKILDDELRGKMERYVTLKVGNIAPDIQLTTTKKLSDTGTNILLVFGSSECGYCIDDKKKLENLYPKWQEKGTIEVVYISIDTNKTDFETVYKNTPWETYCDFKGWENQAAKDYFINATPTYVLLDKDLKILIHPKSVEHVDTWVNYKL